MSPQQDLEPVMLWSSQHWPVCHSWQRQGLVVCVWELYYLSIYISIFETWKAEGVVRWLRCWHTSSECFRLGPGCFLSSILLLHLAGRRWWLWCLSCQCGRVRWGSWLLAFACSSPYPSEHSWSEPADARSFFLCLSLSFTFRQVTMPNYAFKKEMKA